MPKKLTIKEFKERANKVHNGKYGYDDTVYVNSYTKVTIKCPIHGKFEQAPSIHLRGHGCPKCRDEENGKRQSLTTEEFKKKANKVHKGKYGYDDTVYVNSCTKVIINCPIHGKFEQEAGMHIRGVGCPKCGKEKVKQKRSLTTEEFIERANKVHNGKYGYDDTVYINTRSKVTIKCSIHGNFEQLAHCHLQGHGCPKCNSSKLENEIKKLLTENEIKFKEQEPFPWLVGPNGGPQTLDFYLPDLSIGIECQGGQHFYAVDFFGGEESLKYTQECDQNKQDLCKAHGIEVLYYSNLSTPDSPYSYPYKVHEDLEEIMNIIKTKLQTLTK